MVADLGGRGSPLPEAAASFGTALPSHGGEPKSASAAAMGFTRDPAATPAPVPPNPSLVALAHQPASPISARLLMARREGDASRMTIQLDPVELGSVEVAVRIDDRGAAAATFVVERPETLALLQRDSRVLVAVLADAGFTLDPGGLGFQLRDERREQGRPHEPRPFQPERQGGGGPVGSPTAASLPLGRGLYDLRV